MNKDQTGTGAAGIQNSDEKSTKTSVVSSAEGSSIQEDTEKLAAEERVDKLRKHNIAYSKPCGDP
jgi:hypothetical protein